MRTPFSRCPLYIALSLSPLPGPPNMIFSATLPRMPGGAEQSAPSYGRGKPPAAPSGSADEARPPPPRTEPHQQNGGAERQRCPLKSHAHEVPPKSPCNQFAGLGFPQWQLSGSGSLHCAVLQRAPFLSVVAAATRLGSTRSSRSRPARAGGARAELSSPHGTRCHRQA